MTTLGGQFEIKQIMNGHFSHVARYYRHLRTTDMAPINFIKRNVVASEFRYVADVGCGTGRYSYLLLRHLDIRHMLCIDASEKMLRANGQYLRTKGILNYGLIRASAEGIPLASNTVDCMFSFNAVHHFKVAAFLDEAARILKTGGKVFVYTRLKSQNATNIWGMYFPSFLDKENRLYELEELESAIGLIEAIDLESVEEFSFKRKTSLAELTMRARLKHYSTFSLYGKDEFSRALRAFEDRISTQFTDLNNITWRDDYTMLVIKK
jgi:ubiquinone/menaquinone biosynthesis C-methylase UbiE